VSDLFDEADDKVSKNIGTTVHTLGGDLLDEVSIRDKKPEGISDAMKEQALTDGRKELLQSLNDDMGLWETFKVGAGRGLATVGRAVGMVEPEDPATTEAFGSIGTPGGMNIPLPGGTNLNVPIDPKSMAAGGGEIVGESAPFAPFGVMASGLKMGIARSLANIGIGAAEGGAIIKGKGGDLAETTLGAGVGGVAAGIIDVVFPHIGRAISAAFKRLGKKPVGPLLTPDGVPTPELEAALGETGTSFDGIVADAAQQAQRDLERGVETAADRGFVQSNVPGVNPGEAARAARFESQGIPATKGDITQNFDAQSAEQRLAVTTRGKPSDAMRQMRLEQSEAFKARAGEMVDSLGMPAEAGERMKTALTSRKATLRAEKNALYKAAADADPTLMNMPLIPDDIVMAIPDRKKLRRLARLAPQQMKALDDLLVEFGLDDTPELVEAFTGEIAPLSLGNFEDFRAALNQIDRSDISGTAGVAIRPIREALDAEAGMLDRVAKAVGMTDTGVVDTLKKARKRVRTLKTEFSDQAITGRLINVKRDGVTPVIEASKAANEVLKPTAKIEHLQRTLSSLHKSGKKGMQAIKDMQASVVLGALDASLKAPSRKTAGIETVGGYQFAKYLDDIGDEKLKLLFRGNDEGLAQLMNLKQTALDFSASANATPKGSASVNMDIAAGLGKLFSGFSGIPGLNIIVNAFAKGGDTKAVRAALDASPEVVKSLSRLETQFPALAASLGAATAVSATEDD